MLNYIILKEFKSIKFKSTLLIIVLSAIFLFTVSLGQIFILKSENNITVKGLKEIVNIINQTKAYTLEFQSRVTIYALMVPFLLYFFYLGFPYLLGYYNQEKMSKNLQHLLITPLKIKDIIVATATFGTLNCVIPAVIILLINSAIFIALGLNNIINIVVLLLALFFMTIITFTLLYFFNSILWITNCSKIVYNICRVFLVFGMCTVFILMGRKFELSILLNKQVMVVTAGLSLLFYLAGSIIGRFISKERIFLCD
jgi:hypothetical protein